MIDRREAILSRIVTLLDALPDFKDVRRNERPDESILPAAVVLDGDEELRTSPDDERWRYPLYGGVMALRPEIHLLTSAEPANAGPSLSALRRAVINALLHDEAEGGLIDLCHARRGGSGHVRYVGMGTAYAAGRALRGEAHLSFSLAYPFKPSDLL